MEIRGVHESELEEMIDLQCLVYRPDGHERYWRYVREDSSYRNDQARVVVVNGRIVSTLRVWERRMRIGSCIVRMGGIGGVGTHPDYRGVGYANALMNDTIDYMRTVGYDLGVLFSIIPCEFYRKLGWESFPLEGFQITRRRLIALGETEWQIQPFDEERDLEAVSTLYDEHNAEQSGSIVRSRSYWDMGPSRLRDILPTVVARRGETLGGYLNFQITGKRADVLEVAYEHTDATSLIALTNHLLHVCHQEGIEEICGDIPHRHPIVDLLVEGCSGDLFLTGTTSMMVQSVNLSILLRQLLPDFQSRLDASDLKFGPLSVRFEVGNQEAVLRLHDSGELQIFNADANPIPLPLPGRFFWRALFGESSWRQIEPNLQARNIRVEPEVSALLSVLFPQQSVIFWGPDHY